MYGGIVTSAAPLEWFPLGVNGYDIYKEWDKFLKMYETIRECLRPDEVVVCPDILAKAILGDHFETVNPDRPDTQTAYGNPDSRIFHSVSGDAGPATSWTATYGRPDGGGRVLMVPKWNADLSVALMDCALHGLRDKTPALTETQAGVLTKAIADLGAEDYEARAAAAKAILRVGAGSIPKLEEALAATRDAEVAERIKVLLPKLALFETLSRCRAARAAELEKAPRKEGR
jgi:hypothetical protein